MMDKTDYEVWIGKLMGRGMALTWPKDHAGQLALLGAAALALDPSQRYSEKEVNEALAAWLGIVLPKGGLDHVTVRRYLIDFRFLDRESDGSAYWVNRDELAQEFEPAVFDLDTSTIIREFKEAEAARRKAWRAKRGE